MPGASLRGRSVRTRRVVCANCNDYSLPALNPKGCGIHDGWNPLSFSRQRMGNESIRQKVTLMECCDVLDKFGVRFHWVRLLDGLHKSDMPLVDRLF